MMQRLLISCLACGIAMAQTPGGATSGIGSETGAAPGTALPPSGKPLPKMSNGKPDLSGTWVWIIRDAAKVDNTPYRPEFLPKVKALAKDYTADPAVHCFLLGTPRVTAWGFLPFKIVQSPKETIILYEAMRTFRDIPTDGRGHSRDLDNTFMGESIGHWEQDTLIVDTIGFNDKTWLDVGGKIHSEDLHVVERYSPTADGRIHYEAVAEDPKMFTRPWKVLDGTIGAAPGGDMVSEYECIEGNGDIEHLKAK
ncbi:MAG: hypothetical protein M3N93_02405 [Acidobacteriota bacterium]|nr:hypothetical protein [Acidobacteriota bacterium]